MRKLLVTGIILSSIVTIGGATGAFAGSVHSTTSSTIEYSTPKTEKSNSISTPTPSSSVSAPDAPVTSSSEAVSATPKTDSPVTAPAAPATPVTAPATAPAPAAPSCVMVDSPFGYKMCATEITVDVSTGVPAPDAPATLFQ